MKAFLLAAGLGTRLRPLTDTVPKCLVEVGGRPMLDIWLDALAEAGVDEVLVNTHHLAERSRSTSRAGPAAAGAAPARTGAARQRGHPARQPVPRRGRRPRPRDQRGQPHRRRPAGARGRASARRAGRHAHGLPGSRPSECGIVEVTDGVMTGFVEKPAAAPQRPGQRRHLRLRARASRRDPRAAAPRHRLRPAAPARRPGRRRGARQPLLPRHRVAGRAGAGPPDLDGTDARMIITQTPLRVGLVGGGTDLPDYYREHGGRVLNAAIDKYVYVVVKQRFDDDIYVNYSAEGDRLAGRGPAARARPRGHAHGRGPGRGRDHDAGRHPVGRVRPRLLVRGHRRPAAGAVRLPGAPAHRPRSWPSAPARSRSTAAASRSASRTSTPRRTAASATSGSAPAIASLVDQLPLTPQVRRQVQDELLLFFTGITRSANTILGEQTANIADRLPQLGLLRDLAGEAADGLREGDVDALGVRSTRAGLPSASWPPGSRTRRSTRP